jgi:hypothetical protein
VVIEQCNWFTRIRIGGRIIGGGIFCDVWGGETEDSRNPRNRNFVKFCKEAEDIRTFENAQKNRKSIEPFSS